MRRLLKSLAPLTGVEEPYNAPRQILPLVYWQDGYIDITKPSVILEQKSTTGRTILQFTVDAPAADIDTLMISTSRNATFDDFSSYPESGSNSDRHPS